MLADIVDDVLVLQDTELRVSAASTRGAAIPFHAARELAERIEEMLAAAPDGSDSMRGPYDVRLARALAANLVDTLGALERAATKR